MSDLGTNVDICDPWVKTKDLPERYNKTCEQSFR